MQTGFWWDNLKERDHLEDRGVGGKIFKKWNGGLDWIYMAQDRDRWRNFMNALLNVQVP